MSTPACFTECSAVLRDGMAELGNMEVTISTAPPIIASPFNEAFVCPHGVRYWMEPTGDQRAQWARDGVL